LCTSVSTSPLSVKCLPPRWNCFTWQTLPNINKKHFFTDILCIESFWPQKSQERTSLFGNTLLKHGRHFDYWKQPLNMCIRVGYLDCHEAGMCCYILNDTYRKPIMSITAVSLPFGTYLLTLHRTIP
jgi:hypothetical protein